MLIEEDQHRWFISFFDKECSGDDVDAKPNYQLANKLHKQIITKLKR